MERFEVGRILNPFTRQAMGRVEFYNIMAKAVRRCQNKNNWKGGDYILSEVKVKWARLGWWCNDRLCDEGDILRQEAWKTLYGLNHDDVPLTEIRAQMLEQDGALKELQALHDSLQDLPCSIWFSREDVI